MSKRKSKKSLSGEDKILWKQVAETITPLSQKRGEFLIEEMAKLLGETVSPISAPIASTPKSDVTQSPILSKVPVLSSALHSHPIEERIAKNLAKGRQHIDSRIDLHGMTQDRARFALLDFLQMAQRSGDRIVLVITGKGNDGKGVLKRNVPIWLSLPQFKLLVNGFRISHSSHGGEGALYVRLRKLHQNRTP